MRLTADQVLRVQLVVAIALVVAVLCLIRDTPVDAHGPFFLLGLAAGAIASLPTCFALIYLLRGERGR